MPAMLHRGLVNDQTYTSRAGPARDRKSEADQMEFSTSSRLAIGVLMEAQQIQKKLCVNRRIPLRAVSLEPHDRLIRRSRVGLGLRNPFPNRAALLVLHLMITAAGTADDVAATLATRLEVAPRSGPAELVKQLDDCQFATVTLGARLRA